MGGESEEEEERADKGGGVLGDEGRFGMRGWMEREDV
jgi:hypothetical protein